MRPDATPIETLLWRTFTPAILVVAIGLAVLVYNRLYDTILDGFSRQLVTTSALAGALVDPVDHDWLSQAALVGAPADLIEASPRYRRNADPLKRIRRELDLTYLYTQVLGGTKDVVYVLDSTEGEEHSPLGSEDELTPETRAGLKRTTTDGSVYISPIEFQEQWGLLKTAAAPVRDASGRIAATAGADVNISVIEVATQNALFASALIGVASLAASGIVTLLIVRWVARPIEGLKADALRIAAGDRAPPVRRAAPRDVTRLRDALADLATGLIETMRTGWSDILALDHARNRASLQAAVPPAAPVTMVAGPGLRVVWEPRDDSLDARLEACAMDGLAARFAADAGLAARWQELACPAFGDLRIERPS